MKDIEFAHLAMNGLDALCYIADLSTYELLYINEVGKKVTGILDTNFKGRKCYDVLQGKNEVCSFCSNKKLAKGIYYKWEYYNANLKAYYNVVDTIVEFKGKDVRLEYAFDITATKKTIAKLESKLTFEEALVKCAQALSKHKNMKDAINNLLGIICSFFEADRAYIFEISDNNMYIDNTYEWNAEGVEPQIDNLQMVPKKAVALWFERFETEGEFFITSLGSDVVANSSAREILEPQGIDSLMTAPLERNDKIIGFLGVDNPKTNTLDTSFIRSVTLFVASELEKKKISDKLEHASYIDVFTGIYNRNKYVKVINGIVENCSVAVGIVFLDINGLKKANDEYGHEYGDAMILKLVDLLRIYFPYELFRIGGDEFIGLYFGNNRMVFEEASLRLKKMLEQQTEVSASMGVVWCVDTDQIVERILRADELMYANKKHHYNETGNNSKPNKKAMGDDGKYQDDYYQIDPIKGFLNKESTENVLQIILKNSIEIDNHVLFVVNINNFESTGKLSGSLRTESILHEIGVGLRRIMRTEDIVGYINENQFVIFLRNAFNVFAIKQKAEEIIFIIKKHTSANNKDNLVSSNIGISRFKLDGMTYEDLYSKASNAMNIAKQNGHDQYYIFSRDTELKQTDTPKFENINTFFNKHNEQNILLQAFQILQSSSNSTDAIHEVLKMAAKEFDVSRVFVFELDDDKKSYSNTYEWCTDGIASSMRKLQNVPAQDYLYIMSLAKEDGIIKCNDIRQIEGRYRTSMEEQGVQSFLKGFVKVNGTPQILVGVEDYTKTRKWTDAEAISMVYLANLLAMFSKQVENFGLTKKFDYLKNLVEIDTLTGIPSKEKFYADTKEMLENNSDKKFVFILININKFQMINSFYGMDEGDRLLKLISNDLNVLSEKSLSTYGRMGADIFCMCEELIEPINIAAKRVLNEIDSSILSYRFDYNLSASIGIFEVLDNTLTMELMYSKAFMAAKKIKHLKTTSYSIYEDYMELEGIDEQTIVNDMFPGLVENQFEVYLHPKVELISEEVVGAEALVRWNHPAKGFILPKVFVPIFEKNGLITKIDYFVWETVFKFLEKQLHNGNVIPVPISVNISRVDLFNINLITCFEEFLQKYDVPSELLHIEITESAYTVDFDEVGGVINELKLMGFHIEMDDFGTGYSSLNMFSEMIVDTLKLDINFLKDLHINGDKHDILTFIISLARHYNLSVVAEGIETAEQFEFLKGIGCNIGQGYYFSKPMPMARFSKYLLDSQNQKKVKALESETQILELCDILYPDQKNSNFFQKGMSASVILKVSDNIMSTIRYNEEFFEFAGLQDDMFLYQNSIRKIFHEDDIVLLFETLSEAEKIRKTVSCNARVLNLKASEDSNCPVYNSFHICFKLINRSHQSYVVLLTFEKLNKD